MPTSAYLVFGDLHGHVAQAFALARAWSREHHTPLAGLLQVGDLGDSRLEDGDEPISPEPDVGRMWFTAGNHEDFASLKARERAAGLAATSFPFSHAGLTRCIRDGHVAELPGGLRVAALWGIDGDSRRIIPSGGRIRKRSAASLASAGFDVLLTHDSPRDAIHADSGSEEVTEVIRRAQPAFAFFGHYHPTGKRIEGDFGPTRVHYLSHLEFRSRAEEGSVGLLTWDGSAGEFAYLDPAWLRTITRSNWRHR
jgi:hypothetical protein